MSKNQPLVETRDASSIMTTAAFINGRILDDCGSTIIERRFDWGTTPTCEDDWTADVTVVGNNFFYFLTGLTPGTTYYFRTWAKNSAGWSHGNVLRFTTTSPSIDLSPSSHSFGSVEVGSCSSEYSFTLTNTGGGTATGTVSRTGTHATQFTITQGSGSFSLSAGASKTIKVKFCPTSTGSKTATLYADGSNCNDDSSSLSGTGVENTELSYSPASHDFCDMCEGVTDSTTFEIWNSGTGTLTYTLSETCGWVDVNPKSGSSTGEHDTITVDIDTTGLSEGPHTCDISIGSNGGSGTFTVTVNVVPCPETVVSIEDASAPQGGTVTVPINIAGVENMCGASIWLNYNKDVVIVDSVSDGDLVPLTHSIDNTAGVTKMNWDTTSGMTGDFVFAYVTLKAVGNQGDTCLLDLDVNELYDCVPPFNEIPRTVDDGTFMIPSECGNMNVNPTSWSPPTINCGDSDSQIVTVSATGGTVEGVTVSKICGET